MQTTQHPQRCPIYLHPAACSSPAAVAAIQHRTGLLIITNLQGRAQAVKPHTAPAADLTPFGGDAA